MPRLTASCLLLWMCLSTGCQGLDRPRWFNPGPAEYQQRQAVRFDPYPDNDIGPPVVGGRPPSYSTQPPEVTRARWTRGQWGFPRFTN